MLSWEVLNFALNAAMLAGVVAGAYVLRRLYFSMLTDLTSLGDAGRQVRRLIARSEALLRESEEGWARYEAARADAEAQRVRFLEAKVRERDAASASRSRSASRSAAADDDGGARG